MVNVLVLNFARPHETELCLTSIKNFCKFEHKVILYNNGNRDTNEIHKFLTNGLVDEIFGNTENIGGGAGTVRLFEESDSEYSLWIECDCEIAAPITQDDIDFWIKFLENGNYKCIDLTNGICGHNIYSGRSFFINTEFYNSIDKFELDKDGNKLYGGPGPYNHIKYLEQFIQEYFKENNFNIAHIPGIKDNGYSSIRENPDLSQWKHEPDTKRLWLVKGPVKEKYIYPKFTDEEFNSVIETQTWPPGQIPENERADSFIVPHWHE